MLVRREVARVRQAAMAAVPARRWQDALAPGASCAPIQKAVIPATPLSPEAQIGRIAATGASLTAGTEDIVTLQSSAARQLDAAAYALTRMSAELRGVMDLPQPAQVATVHRLEPLVSKKRKDVWKKVAAA